MPLAVYSVGCAIGTESPSWRMAANLAVVVAGVIVATAGRRAGASQMADGSVAAML